MSSGVYMCSGLNRRPGVVVCTLGMPLLGGGLHRTRAYEVVV